MQHDIVQGDPNVAVDYIDARKSTLMFVRSVARRTYSVSAKQFGESMALLFIGQLSCRCSIVQVVLVIAIVGQMPKGADHHDSSGATLTAYSRHGAADLSGN